MGEPSIVMTRTPLRVSLIGGGSDTPEFYRHHGLGQVVSLALNKYIYVVVKKHAPIFGEYYRLSYSKNEIVEKVDDIENNIIRECIRFSNCKQPLYVSTFSDIPAASGLGSSSALTVGLMNALHAIKGEPVTRSQLAREACVIEIEKLNEPIGKQDQYASAFGGLNKFSFESDDTVSIQGLNLSTAYLSSLLSSASLYWTGLSRQTGSILHKQKENFSAGKIAEVQAVASSVNDLSDALENAKPICEIASMVRKSWALKKGFAKTISNPAIDKTVELLEEAGGLGGKLCGGGGGGFILMFHPPALGNKLLECSDSNFRIPLGMDFSGSEILQVA